MATEIKYNDSVIATVEAGKTKILKCKGKKMRGDVEVKSGGGTSGFPIEIDALDNALLVSENTGKVYKCDNKLYQVHKITSLKGLTIKFNEHITPCPVIGEDDEFECSGTMVVDDGLIYGENRAITELSRKAITDSWATSGATSIVITVGYNEEKEGVYDTYYSPNTDNVEGAGWYQLDYYLGNDGKMFVSSPAITNFDCPALNENPAFIEWVFANAKVYPNFESPNDIKSFKLDLLFRSDGNAIGGNLQSAFFSGMFEANRTGVVFEFDVDGQFTATFLVNGELVTKTFTNVNVCGNVYGSGGLPVFSNDADNLVFLNAVKVEDGIFDENGNLLASPIKYNDIYLENGIEFTKFNCMLNTKTKDILSFILCYTTVSGEYHNGFAFKEYESSLKEYDGTVEVK